jgi:phage terminase large subunit-like protein
MQELLSDGFDVKYLRQGHATLSSMTEEFELAVLGTRLIHGGHPILREQARVAAADQDAYGHIRPSKKRSGDKIDGIVATVMGIGLAMQGEGGGSVYEERGIIVI